MPKLILRRISSRQHARKALREDALAAVQALPGAAGVSVLLESDGAVRIEFAWKDPRFDLIEEHLNQRGLSSEDYAAE
ncbi:hypothetical protein [Lysobacter sp. Hz 25]|uniref:hypothetical protein n=1 Tax=Lysobacter sp. Hz 25 TaxID=3383698 RepID=UPI0038D4DE73